MEDVRRRLAVHGEAAHRRLMVRDRAVPQWLTANIALPLRRRTARAETVWRRGVGQRASAAKVSGAHHGRRVRAALLAAVLLLALAGAAMAAAQSGLLDALFACSDCP